jgi:hypothetical protein
MEVKPTSMQAASAELRPDAPRREPDRQKAGRDAGLNREMRFSAFAWGDSATEERESAFARKMNHALGEIGPALGAGSEADGMRLLAMAGGGSPFHFTATSAADAPAAISTVNSTMPTIDAIVDRVEAALNAQRIDTPVAGVSLKLDLSGIGGSISGMTISLSPTTIDLVLTRGAGEANATFVEAAQALADRLHVRFAKRVVRVLEVDEKPTAVADGLSVISALLSRPAGRRDL